MAAAWQGENPTRFLMGRVGFGPKRVDFGRGDDEGVVVVGKIDIVTIEF